MALIESDRFFAAQNPVDTFEDVVGGFDWPYERLADEKLTITIRGSWCDYHMSVTWVPDLAAIQMSATLDVKVPGARHSEIHTLLAYINEKQWLGHFDLWSEESVLRYRLALPLGGVEGATHEQCETMMQVVVEACERYYPAFQFVLWAGKTAREAIDASMFDTVGTA